MPPTPACARAGPPSSEVTGAFCRVPSTPFSQAPGYALPVHLCRFGVRSYGRAVSWNPSPCPLNPIRANKTSDPSLLPGPRILTWFPSVTRCPPHLRGRLTLRRLALRRNPWTFGESVFHTLYRYSCQHSHFRYLQPASRPTFTGLRNAPLPRASCDAHPYLRRMA